MSLGLCYLHNHNPLIVHCDLSLNNVLLTAHRVAKISDLGMVKVIKADSRKTITIKLQVYYCICLLSRVPIVQLVGLPWACFHLLE